MEPPLAKKQKTETKNDPVFSEFRKDKENLKRLEDAYENILKGYSRMNLCLHQISESDARSCQSFTQATCDVHPHKKNRVFVVYAIGSIFFDGMYVLKKYLQDDPLQIPKDKEPREALSRLLRFFSISHGTLTSPKADLDECEWAVTLAQHLFSELSVVSRYTIDSKYQKGRLPKSNSGQFLCPCGNKDELKGRFDDTSFGCRDAWHGYVDILMESVPVRLTDGCGEIDTDYANESSVEVKSSDEFLSKDISQIIVQTIVFSFLQNQTKSSKKHTLVPALGVCREKVVVNFYDCEHDILLSTCSLNLFKHFDEEKFLNTDVVLLIWLALNHKCFCSGVTESMKEYKANFFKHAGDYLEKYKQCVMRNVHLTPNQSSMTLSSTWADEHGKVEEPVVKITCKALE